MLRDKFVKHITLGFGLSEDKQKDLLIKARNLKISTMLELGHWIVRIKTKLIIL
jgi:hypothetical protein